MRTPEDLKLEHKKDTVELESMILEFKNSEQKSCKIPSRKNTFWLPADLDNRRH